MARWILTDNSTGSPVELTFSMNPNTFSPPGRSANIQNESTTAPNGQPIIFQGYDQNRRLTFSGTVISQSAYNDLNTWKDKRNVLMLTDDQGQTWSILFASWNWTRKKSALNQWRFGYDAEAIVM